VHILKKPNHLESTTKKSIITRENVRITRKIRQSLKFFKTQVWL